jgi:diadenosine tetraphosphate (Ap4A) HIT family hydrolase
LSADFIFDLRSSVKNSKNMAETNSNCIQCRGIAGDAEIQRIQVWENSLWRLTVSLDSEVEGFAYLEPKRHISYITDLDGEEARTFGEVLALVSRALRGATDSELVYVYIFGGSVPHLHIHLAPHRSGDALNSQMIKGEIETEILENEMMRFISKDFPPLPSEKLREVAQRIERELNK